VTNDLKIFPPVVLHISTIGLSFPLTSETPDWNRIIFGSAFFNIDEDSRFCSFVTHAQCPSLSVGHRDFAGDLGFLGGAHATMKVFQVLPATRHIFLTSGIVVLLYDAQTHKLETLMSNFKTLCKK
jgi:hypothetical protein